MSYFQGDWGQPWGKKHPVLSQNEKGQDSDNSLIEQQEGLSGDFERKEKL